MLLGLDDLITRRHRGSNRQEIRVCKAILCDYIQKLEAIIGTGVAWGQQQKVRTIQRLSCLRAVAVATRMLPFGIAPLALTRWIDACDTGTQHEEPNP